MAAGAHVSAADAGLRIGQLGKATGFTPKTLRYYETIGLLLPDARSRAKYRLFGSGAIERLRIVRKARGLGLSLSDIKTILDMVDGGTLPCPHVIAVVDREMVRIDAQVKRLRSLRRDLSDLKAKMSTQLNSGQVPAGSCPCFDET